MYFAAWELYASSAQEVATPVGLGGAPEEQGRASEFPLINRLLPRLSRGVVFRHACLALSAWPVCP